MAISPLKIEPNKIKAMIYSNIGVEYTEDELFDSINHIRVISDEEYFIEHQGVKFWFNQEYQVLRKCHKFNSPSTLLSEDSEYKGIINKMRKRGF